MATTAVAGILALILGLFAHTLKQMITSRVTGGRPIGFVEYYLSFRIETLFAVVVSIGMYMAYPEVGDLIAMPSFIEWPDTQTPLGGFVCGFFGNSLADLLGARLSKVVNG